MTLKPYNLFTPYVFSQRDSNGYFNVTAKRPFCIVIVYLAVDAPNYFAPIETGLVVPSQNTMNLVASKIISANPEAIISDSFLFAPNENVKIDGALETQYVVVVEKVYDNLKKG